MCVLVVEEDCSFQRSLRKLDTRFGIVCLTDSKHHGSHRGIEGYLFFHFNLVCTRFLGSVVNVGKAVAPHCTFEARRKEQLIAPHMELYDKETATRTTPPAAYDEKLSQNINQCRLARTQHQHTKQARKKQTVPPLTLTSCR